MVPSSTARFERDRLAGLVLRIRAVVYWIAGAGVLLDPDVTTAARAIGIVAVALASTAPLITRRSVRYSGIRLSALSDIVVAYLLWLTLPAASGISLILPIWGVGVAVFFGSNAAARRITVIAVVAELSKVAVLLIGLPNGALTSAANLQRLGESGIVVARSAVIVGAYLAFRTVQRHLAKISIAVESGSERYRRWMDGAPTAFIVLDSGTISYANAAAISLLGCTSESIVHRRILGFVDRDDVRSVTAALAHVSDTLEPIDVPNVRLRLGENTPWVDLTMTPVDFTGQLSVQVALFDRSAQRSAEDALRRSEDRFRAFFERIPVPLYRSRPDGTILDANLALAKLFGGDSVDELVGRNAHEFYVDATDREIWTDMIDVKGTVVGYETTMVRMDGSTAWVRDTSTRLETESGTVYEGAMLDVSSRHRVQEELWSRALQQEAAARIGQQALEAKKVTDVMSAVTETVASVMNVSGSVVFERGPFGNDVLHGTVDGIEVVPADLATVADRAHMTAAPVVLRTADEVRFAAPALAERSVGSLAAVMIPGIELDFGTIVVFTENERVFSPDDLNFLQSVANVLAAAIERAAAAEELAEQLRSKDAFVASVSHELRTPLTVVSGIAHELQDRWTAFSQEEAAEFISLLADQSDDMGNLIEDLLIAARSDIGNVVVRSEEVSVVEVVESVLHGFTHGDEVKIRNSVVDAVVDADPIRVRQILRNLLTNAIRYGGPNIELRSSTSAGVVAIHVADDGDGVADEDIERIFQAYERAHDAKGQPGSVGIGLTVSRTLAGLMAGSLTYVREEGRTVFTLELPRTHAGGSEVAPDAGRANDEIRTALGSIRSGRIGVDVAAIE